MNRLSYILIPVVGLIMSMQPLYAHAAASGDTVFVTDFGAIPSARKSVVYSVKKAIEACRGKTSAVLKFPHGRYDFWYDGTLPDTVAQIAITLTGLKNLTIDGDGSEFIFHGRMTAIKAEACENLALKNFSIDWDRPLTSQAIINEITNEYIELRIDPSAYPYFIENGKLCFTGEGWKSPVVHYILFDKENKEVVPLTRDNALGDIFDYDTREVSPGLVRLYGQTKLSPEPGTYLALYAQRELSGIYLYKNINTTLEDIRMYYALGGGILSFMCDGLHFNRVNVQPNEEKKRVFSSMADATYFPNCKGLIRIENCMHAGQADDWANFRGTYTKVAKVTTSNSIHISNKSGRSRPDNYYNVGDEIYFVNTATMQRGTEGFVIKEVSIANKEEIKLTFTQAIPSAVNADYVVENMTWTPEVEVVNCVIPRKNRARGILLTTPKRALFEKNLFQTAGTAILVEGDIDVWYEAGAVRDFTIRDNIFENCMSSAEPGDWCWGEAVICITPSHKPQTDNDEPYHQHIRIENNTFRYYDYNLLYARSVRGLTFENNRIEYTDTYIPHGRKVNFYLDGCREVHIKDNVYDPNYPPRKAELHHMKKKELHVGKTEKISVSTDPAK
ncbi:MAG: hypothetical protein LBT83_05015 [Tannerella sp.]|nr:hypothetical protein [Tannerella sp.]